MNHKPALSRPQSAKLFLSSGFGQVKQDIDEHEKKMLSRPQTAKARDR